MNLNEKVRWAKEDHHYIKDVGNAEANAGRSCCACRNAAVFIAPRVRVECTGALSLPEVPGERNAYYPRVSAWGRCDGFKEEQ